MNTNDSSIAKALGTQHLPVTERVTAPACFADNLQAELMRQGLHPLQGIGHSGWGKFLRSVDLPAHRVSDLVQSPFSSADPTPEEVAAIAAALGCPVERLTVSRQQLEARIADLETVIRTAQDLIDVDLFRLPSVKRWVRAQEALAAGQVSLVDENGEPYPEEVSSHQKLRQRIAKMDESLTDAQRERDRFRRTLAHLKELAGRDPVALMTAIEGVQL